MKYFINKTLKEGTTFQEAIDQVTKALQEEGFGILTEIDIKATFKKKLDVDVEDYIILGACNPNFAYQALQEESKLGVFLPCNVIVEKLKNGLMEVSAMDPNAAMMAVKNEAVSIFAKEVSDILERVINGL